MATNNDEEHKRIIDDLQKWFEENENLPKQIDRILLARFYLCMYKDVEATKKVIEVHYAMRNKAPHIFIDRDPMDEDSKKTFEYADMVPLPGLTTENYRITCFRLSNADPRKMHHTEDTKAFIMLTDCRFAMPDAINDDKTPMLSQGEIQIFDMTGFGMKHATRLSVSTLRTYLKFLQQAFPVRIKAMHMINCPSYLDRLIGVVKPFINKEVFNMMHFHTTGIETLYEQVPKDLLPEEYGGQAGKLSDLKEDFMQIMLKKRDYLIDRSYWKIDNS